MNELEFKRQKIEKWAKVLALPAIAFALGAPVILGIVQGVLGLIALWIIGLVAVNLSPWVSLKLSNLGLKLFKMEASRNPVETLQNDYNKRQQALASFADAIKQFIAEKEAYAGKLDGFRRQYPEEADKFTRQLQTMDQLLELRKAKFTEAKKSLAAYDLEIKKASAIWDMAQAANKMSKAAGMSDQDFFAKIARETAIDSVEKSMTAAFADLEVSLLDEGQQAKVLQLPTPQRETVPAPTGRKTPIT